jgi:SulP family sulfate permease
MGEWKAFARLRQFSPHYRLMLLSTFVVTVVFDLMVAVELGLVLAVVLFVRRQSDIFRAEPLAPSVDGRLRFRLYGSLFFGAVTKIDPLIDAAERAPDGLHMELDASQLVSLDTTGLDALEQLHKALDKRGGRLSITGLHGHARSLIERSGFIDRLRPADELQ